LLSKTKNSRAYRRKKAIPSMPCGQCCTAALPSHPFNLKIPMRPRPQAKQQPSNRVDCPKARYRLEGAQPSRYLLLFWYQI